MKKLNPKTITDADIQLAEQWRMWAVEITYEANCSDANSWAARALKEAARYLGEAALHQDQGEGAAQGIQCSVCRTWSTNFYIIDGVAYCSEHVPHRIGAGYAPLQQHTPETFQANIEATWRAGWDAAVKAAEKLCQEQAKIYQGRITLSIVGDIYQSCYAVADGLAEAIARLSPPDGAGGEMDSGETK